MKTHFKNYKDEVACNNTNEQNTYEPAEVTCKDCKETEDYIDYKITCEQVEEDKEYYKNVKDSGISCEFHNLNEMGFDFDHFGRAVYTSKRGEDKLITRIIKDGDKTTVTKTTY